MDIREDLEQVGVLVTIEGRGDRDMRPYSQLCTEHSCVEGPAKGETFNRSKWGVCG